jgi:hypothetical protein
LNISIIIFLVITNNIYRKIFHNMNFNFELEVCMKIEIRLFLIYVLNKNIRFQDDLMNKKD